MSSDSKPTSARFQMPPILDECVKMLPPKPEDHRAYLIARIEHALMRGTPDPRENRALLQQALEVLKGKP